MKEYFKDWNPRSDTIDLMNSINAVLDAYRQQGYKLTLRQLYYQLVSRDIIPNSLRSYAKIGDIVSNGRLAGYIDWDMIEDRVRVPSVNQHWDSPKEILRAAANSFYRDHWVDQECYVEVWCEKDAVSNIIEPVCRKWDVLFMANRGYTSQSVMYDAYRRFRSKVDDRKCVTIIYFGDHDPSGMDMTRDIDDRMGLMVYGYGKFGDVDRVALNIDQIEAYGPPENPAKQTDSRFKTYELEYGSSSWELDALEPRVLSELVETAVLRYLDRDKWDDVETQQFEERRKMREFADGFGG